MSEGFGITATLKAVDRMSGPIKQAAASAKQLGSTADKTEEQLSGVGSKSGISLKTVGKGMAAAGAAVTAMGIKSVKSFGNFQASLNKAAVTAGGTSKDISGLADVANKMGADLPLSAQDSADAMIEMAQAGADVSTIKEQFPAVAQAATAAGSDLIQTAGVVQNAMNIWGDSLKSPKQAAADLTITANASNASIEDMQQALATIGGSAKASGMSLQTTSTAIGLLTNQGFSAAQASQDLNHAILQMQAPSSVAQKSMKSLGLSFTDAQGNMKPFPQILGEISDSMDGMTSSEKQKNLKAMFGTAGMQAIGPLLKSIKDDTGSATTSWDGMFKKIQQGSGTVAAAGKTLSSQASEMQKNVGSKIEQVGGNWESLRNKAMDAKGGVSGAMVDMINNVLNWATTSNNGIAKVIRGFVGLSPVLGPALVGIGGFLIVASKVGPVVRGFASGVKLVYLALSNMAKISKIAAAAQAAFNIVMSMNPFVLIISAVVALVAALILFFTKTKIGQSIVSSVVSFIQSAWQGLLSFLQPIFDTIGNIAKSVWNGLVAVVSSVVQSIIGVWNGFVQSISPIITAIKGLWNSLVVFFSTLWQLITTVAIAVWNGLVALMIPIINGIKAVWTTIAPFFAGMWNGVVTVFTAVWNVIMIVVQTAIQNIQIVIQTVMAIVVAIWTTIWNVVKTVASTVWNIIVTVISTALKVMSSVIKAATSLIKGDWKGAWNNIKSIFNTVWKAMKTIVSSVIKAIRSVISSGVRGIKSIWDAGIKGLKNVVSSVWNGIKSLFHAGVSFIKSVVHVNLSGAGSAIMNSFLGGLKSVWSSVKNFVGGIGSWIKKHKGPISYDRKLLIPAGAAIMNGLNRGLTDQFKTVQANVSSMAGQIAASVEGISPDFNSAIDSIQSLSSSSLSSQINGSLALDDTSIGQQNSLLRQLVNKQQGIYLDGDKLVGGTSDRMDATFARTSDLKGRWSR